MWLDRLVNKLALKKTAIEKLPADELNGSYPPFVDLGADPGAPGADPMGGMAPPMPAPPLVEEPLVFDNKYLVQTDSTKFIVELKPSIVTVPMPDPNVLPPAQTDPMADTALNPGADPNSLGAWMAQNSKDMSEGEKPYSSTEEGTVDPLARESEGLPIEDSGDEKKLPSVKVHKKAGIEPTPGADRSNAYYPCAVCANYDAADNKCSQGLDVEKVQAAKSCSWLNSNFKPFLEKDDSGIQDGSVNKDTVKNDISDLGGSGAGSGQTGTAGRFAGLKDELKKLWG
jgi:hypothetical protein